ncbi:MAG: hypothetical protein R8K47_06275, partial [Mariprofundaceae bacterium]
MIKPLLPVTGIAPGGPASGHVLPWPNGALLPASLIPSADEGAMRLLLGRYRLMVRVPPNAPSGHVWLEVLQREMPARLRLLTAEQAARRLAEWLAANGMLSTGPERPAKG